jgi:hypothetical protein
MEHQSGSLRIRRLGVRIPPGALSGLANTAFCEWPCSPGGRWQNWESVGLLSSLFKGRAVARCRGVAIHLSAPLIPLALTIVTPPKDSIRRLRRSDLSRCGLTRSRGAPMTWRDSFSRLSRLP